jgi:hypothetical protein
MPRSRDDYDGDDREDDIAISYPLTVRLAAIAWIAFGCLMLLVSMTTCLLRLEMIGAAGEAARQAGAPARGAGPEAVGGVCGSIIQVVFAVAFIGVGIHTALGKARDTLGNAIGSIVFGLLGLGCGGLMIVGGVAMGGAVPIALAIAGGVNVLTGLGLIAVGIMAVVGRGRYLAWRRSLPRNR